MKITSLVKEMQRNYRGTSDTTITPRTKTTVWSEVIEGKTYSIDVLVGAGTFDGTAAVVVRRLTNGAINRIECIMCDATSYGLWALIDTQISLYRDETQERYEYIGLLELSELV